MAVQNFQQNRSFLQLLDEFVLADVFRLVVNFYVHNYDFICIECSGDFLTPGQVLKETDGFETSRRLTFSHAVKLT